MAIRLETGLKKIPGVQITHPVQSNSVFAKFPNAAEDKMRALGWQLSGLVSHPAVASVDARLRARGWQTLFAQLEDWLADITGFSAIFTGVNLCATIFYLRAPGMTMFRMPIFTWNMLVTAILILLAFPVLTAGLVMLYCDRHFGTHIFSVAGGGVPVLWQHLFWFWGHPEVYILALPFFGMVTEIIAVFSRKPVFGYKGMIFATLSIAALSLGVWAHHMFTTGVVLLPFFSIMSLLIAVPTGIKMFNWIGTMWRGQVWFSTAMLMALGFLFTFLIGGLTGIYLASPPLDFFTHDTYFVVGHFHMIMGVAAIFGMFAGTFFSDVEKQIAPQTETWDYRKIAGGYREPVDPPAGQISIPTWKDERYLEFHRGVFTSQAVFKREMRESSEEALNAEEFASLAWLDGDPYPGGELTEAWKKITFNQFHDTAAGSAVGVVYQDAKQDYDQVRLMTDEIWQKALATIAARIDTGATAGVPVLVFNPLGWERSGIATVSVQMPEPAPTVSVLDSSGRALPSQILAKDEQTHTFQLLVDAAHMPSVGYEVLHVVPGGRPSASDLHVEGTTLENAALRVIVDPKSGCITSLYDRKANFETLAPGACGNELQAFHDLPKKYDAWNIDPGTLDEPPVRLTKADSVQVVEKGPLRAVVRVTRTWQSSKFVQNIELYAGSDQVVVANDVDWHERHVLLKAAFPLAASSPFATYEIPYGSIQRPTTRNNSWEKARFEVPALHWADLGDDRQGMSLINDSKYGYDAVGNLLRL